MQGCERKAAITTFPCPSHWILIAAFDDGLNGNTVPIIANGAPAVTSEMCDLRALGRQCP
jgi:hypothetical protein